MIGRLHQLHTIVSRKLRSFEISDRAEPEGTILSQGGSGSGSAVDPVKLPSFILDDQLGWLAPAPREKSTNVFEETAHELGWGLGLGAMFNLF